jgi:3-dehydroquinate synthase
MREIEVRLGSNYRIHIGRGILSQLGHWLKQGGASDKLVIITHPLLKRLYGDSLQENLTREGFKATTLLVPEGEEQKSLETAGRLYSELSNFHAERTTPVLALGGGVIGDLAGFVAATYLRGVPLVQIPTTLLAQVDSSIGGKVAVDHDQLKNKIGAFYQPRLVVSDITVLSTLSVEELGDGLAEVIKYAVIRDKGFFTYLEENLDKVSSLDSGVLEEIVFRSARIKAEIVEKDERDSGLRNILNYGHTVGHAIEAVSDFTVRHGHPEGRTANRAPKPQYR